MSARIVLGRSAPDAATRALDTTVARFAAVGAATTVLDIALFSALSTAGAHPVAANLGSYSCGVLASFALNRAWTFRAGRAGRRALAALGRFALSNAAGLALSTALVAAFATLLHPALAKVASVPVVFVWNYALARFWVFR